MDLASSALEPKDGHRYGTPPFVRDENGNQEEMMKLLKKYGGTQETAASGRTITFDATTLSSPSPTKEKKQKKQKKSQREQIMNNKRDSIEAARKRTPQSKEKKKKSNKENTENKENKEKKETGDTTSFNLDQDWITYLDQDSQCYYESHQVTGHSRWLTWEESNKIGIQNTW